MLYAFILGLALMIGGVLVIGWVANADPKELLKYLKRTLLVVLVLAFVALLVSGRLAWAFGALAVMLPWVMRLLRLLLVGQAARRMFGGMFNNPFSGMGRSASASTGQTSEVSSRFLDMTLDHDSGAMTGRVREGRFAGRDLDGLSQGEALDLWAEVQDDPDSLRLLETWLDRTRPDWREAAEARHAGAEGPAGGGGPMTRDEALAVLGLSEGASAADVKAAYRRLMARAHPDHGGSSWLAARLNEARAVLLKEGG